MQRLTRRYALKVIGSGSSAIGYFSYAKPLAPKSNLSVESRRQDQWEKTHDRVFLGGQFWANPMEDWRVVDGAAECKTTGGDRNIHLITHQLTDPKKTFEMSVQVTRVESRRKDGGAGFRIGIKSDINEYRSNCFIKRGIEAGIVDGKLVLNSQSSALEGLEKVEGITLSLAGKPSGQKVDLTLVATDSTDKIIGEVSSKVAASATLGNIAVVNNFDGKIRKGAGARYRFWNWQVSGDAFKVTPENQFGPILWSMYSLSDSRSDEGFVLKLSALLGPLGEKDNKAVELHLEKNGTWTKAATSEVDTDAYTAVFRIPNWDEKEKVNYKLVYKQALTDGTETESDWTGHIKANPKGRPLRLAALTCQNDYAFPYEPVANNVIKLDADMLYFSGDQLYENHGGYGIIRDPAGPAILNYLRKFYQFGWSFRHALKNSPTICLPDDHDVFHGNIWGEGGAKMTAGSTSSKGGYRQPARMVNVVHRTCTGHHPDFYDTKPSKQDISVYFGDMVYGDVSFAILGDRQFKSGPERVCTWEGRADHVKDESIDVKSIDKEGLELLGKRQEKFVAEWAKDWRGHTMKVLLSQTVFAAVATHHGGYNGYLKADLDSGGWPQTPRDNAINLMRPGMPLHINGDQHLTTLVQYGVKEQRDSFWSFCTPAIAAGYPRWWRPDEIKMEHKNRPEHGLDNTGEFIDGFGNMAYVYAVGNPEVGRDKNRYNRAHQKGSGFGLVTIDTEKKTYAIDSFRFLIDATDGKASNQFPGWPVIIDQKENGGENKLG